MNKVGSTFAATRSGVLAGLAAVAVALVGCAGQPVQMGSQEAKTTATGAAAGGSSVGANTALERCDRPQGTIAVVEDQNANWYYVLTREYRLTSTIPVLRLLIQQSNCFVVVERGRAMANIQQERALQQSGELRQGSNFGKGQLVSADYSLNPEVLFSARDASGVGGALGGLGRGWGVVGAIAGGVKSREAATMLTLVDNRSGVQVGAAEGSASKMDFDVGLAIFGSHAGGGLGGYTNTPEGKVIAAAFTDSYNQLVRALRSYTAQSMGDRGLGTGGRLAVEGAKPPPPPAPAAPAPAAPAPRAATPPPPPPAAVAPAVAAAPPPPPPRPAVASAPVPVTTPPTPVVAAAPATMSLADAQRKLGSLGYDAGTPDGKMGTRTANALRAFQKDRKLTITGRLDQPTIDELAR